MLLWWHELLITGVHSVIGIHSEIQSRQKESNEITINRIKKEMTAQTYFDFGEIDRYNAFPFCV
jgi:hypothetical protein